MSSFPLKSTHKPVKAYYDALAQFQKHGHTTEGNTRSAFADPLKKCAPTYHWHLVEEYQFKGTGKQSLRADGALVDDLILRLIGQVITVSLETQKIIAALPSLNLPA